MKRTFRLATTEDSDSSDPSVELYPQDYCNIVNEVTHPKCLANSIAEIFVDEDYKNGPKDSEISPQAIIDAINNEWQNSNVFLFKKNFTQYLGGIERNATGHIVGAKAAVIQFFGHVNLEAITLEDKKKNSFGAPVNNDSYFFKKNEIRYIFSLG